MTTVQPTESPPPSNSGGTVILRSSDVIEEDIEEWKRQGYTLSEQTEDGYSVFVFKSKVSGSKSKLFSECPVAVYAKNLFTSRLEERAGDVLPCVWRTCTIGTPDDDGQDGRTYIVPGTNDQEVVVELVFQYAYDRNYPGHTGLSLKVKQASFGVLNSFNNHDHRGHFVTRLVVSASPTLEWTTKVDHVTVEPSDDTFLDTFSKENSSTISVGTALSHQIPVEVGYSKSKGITSGSIASHGWSAKRDLRSQCVTWTWELRHWKDGQKFSSSHPAKFKFGSFPELPFAHLDSVQLNKTNVEAEWKIPKAQLIGVEEIQWDINVQFFTATVEKKIWFGYKNRKIGVHMFRVCDNLPPLSSEIVQTLTL